MNTETVYSSVFQKKRDIITSCVKGDRKAQHMFYEKHKAGLYYTALRYARNEEDARDILQEGFIEIFRDLHQYDPNKGAIKTWINRVMINTALRYNRKSDRWSLLSAEDFEERIIAEEEPDYDFNNYTTKQILGIVQMLPDGYRTVFNMHVMDGFTHQEIAEYLGIGINTSKSQLSKAKATIRTELKKTRTQSYIAQM